MQFPKLKIYKRKALQAYVEEIVCLNRSWKKARELFGEESPLSISLRDLKSITQVRMLRDYGMEGIVSMVLDTEAEGEPVFSIRLHDPEVRRRDAEHIPVRIARKYFSEEMLTQLML